MKAWFVALMLVGLVGCKSVQEIRADGSIETYSSAKDEQALALCILFAWQDDPFSGAQVNLQPRPKGVAQCSLKHFENSLISTAINLKRKSRFTMFPDQEA